eukprot:TRINITY_DN9119_c0_g2_i1.p1 TRINITY_DN9119_c0_g2~~TRINITY_DN9119_c0_g2_i1.p1  ORF type:complete len:501 (+),score=69.62 TRINITY_DN9119_c0_g2_i1:99-1601(+)
MSTGRRQLVLALFFLGGFCVPSAAETVCRDVSSFAVQPSLLQVNSSSPPGRTNSTEAIHAGHASDSLLTQKLGMTRGQAHAAMFLLTCLLAAGCATLAYMGHSLSYHFNDARPRDAVRYFPTGLVSWSALCDVNRTLWSQERLWAMACKLLALTLLVALAQLVWCVDPSAVDPLQYSEITNVLNVFVSLMLGFFLSTAIGRFRDCLEGFVSLFENMRALQMQFHALGVPQKSINHIMRYGLLSAWLLPRFMKAENCTDSKRRIVLIEEAWKEALASKDPLLHLTEQEVEILQGVDDPSPQLWMWIASLSGRLAQDEWIPAMASPTYGRILSLSNQAQESLKMIRLIFAVQVPYIYTHTLAVVVHISNMLCAVSMGLTLGACLGSLLIHFDSRLTFYYIDPKPQHEASTDIQVLVIQSLKCFVTPVLYQGFLEIGFCLSSPFAENVGSVAPPVDRMIQEFKADLVVSNRIARCPPGWKPPAWKRDPEAEKIREEVDEDDDE